MFKALTAAALCLLFAGCATDPATGESGEPKPDQPKQAAAWEEREEMTGSHLRRKRQTENVSVTDRETLERQGRPASNITLAPSGR